MPDIEKRETKEAALAALLRRAFGKTRDRIIVALGNPPDVDNVPDSLWDELTNDVEDDLRRAIAIALLRGVRGMNDEYGDSLDFTLRPKDAAVQAERFATRRARSTAADMVSTFRDRVATATGVATERLDRRVAEARREERVLEPEDFEDIADELSDTVDEAIVNQAKAAGRTETTVANTRGEMVYRDAAKKTGRLIMARWTNSPTSNVCPVCRGLNDLWEDEWPEEFRDGPGSDVHPNCNCFLVWEEREI